MYDGGSTRASVYATSVTQIEADSKKFSFAVLLFIFMKKTRVHLCICCTFLSKTVRIFSISAGG